VSAIRSWAARVAGGDGSLAAALRRLRLGATWSVAGAFFNQGSTLLLGIMIANVLGRDAYGSLAIVLSTSMMVSGFAQFGLGLTITRAIAGARADGRAAGAAFSFAIAIATVSAVLAAIATAIFADAVAARLASQPQLGSLILLVTPAIACNAVNAVLTAALSGLGSFRYSAISGIAGGAVYIVGGAAGAVAWDLRGAIVAIDLAAVIQTAVLVLLVRREGHAQGIVFSAWPSRDERAKLLHFAIPSATAGIIISPGMWLVTTILARTHGGLREVALLAAAVSLRALVLFVPHLVNGVAVTLLNHARGIEDERAYRATFWMNLGAVTTLAGMGAGAVFVLAPSILRLFGPTFSAAIPAVTLMLICSIFDALLVGTAQITHSQGRMWRGLMSMTVPQFVVTVGVTVVTADAWGAVGAAAGFLLGSVVALLGAVGSASTLGLGAVPRGDEAAA
jgi:O-antigen/teichoic acid export membrane protein